MSVQSDLELHMVTYITVRQVYYYILTHFIGILGISDCIKVI